MAMTDSAATEETTGKQTSQSAFSPYLEAIDTELRQRSQGWRLVDVFALPSTTSLLTAPPPARIAVLREIFTGRATREYLPNQHLVSDDLRRVAARLLRSKLPLDEVDLAALLHDARAAMFPSWDFPIAGLFGAVEAFVERSGLSPRIEKELRSLSAALARSRDRQDQKLTLRAQLLLGDVPPTPVLAASPWIEPIEAVLAASSAARREKWTALLAHAVTAGEQARPARKWSDRAVELVRGVGRREVGARLAEWLAPVTPDPEQPDPNTNLVKGLIWIAAGLDAAAVAAPLGQFAERCFKKVRGIGPRSVKLGNAALYALAALPKCGGAAQLSRLRNTVRQPGLRRRVEAALAETAGRDGDSIADIEEIAVPDFGLGADATCREPIGDGAVELAVAGSEIVLRWYDGAGKPRSGPSAAMRRENAEEVRAAKRRAKDLAAVLGGQILRLDRLYLSERRWPLAVWRERYLAHPLLATLARRLIWRFDGSNGSVSGLAEPGGLRDASGAALGVPDDATVALWHPLDAGTDEVLAWRRRLAARGIVQPFKQAHREIYVLTDAERQTATYSNRFAAHILRQHQFRALCQLRGWRYELQGTWDSANTPTRVVPGHDFRVEFWVDGVQDTEELDRAGFAYVATDQVRFIDAGGMSRDLATIPALAFSELMREVDLFVGVASVGNDPNWNDRGGAARRFDAYWQSYAFGELGASAKTRREVLEAILPALAIASRCSLDDRFLVVRGVQRTYKIHLGSANIMMEPDDRYLCIVENRSVRHPSEKIFLPFEGDGVLALILSKAFLLAADDKITDPTIRSQIDR
jgi:hypothetical protein